MLVQVQLVFALNFLTSPDMLVEVQLVVALNFL